MRKKTIIILVGLTGLVFLEKNIEKILLVARGQGYPSEFHKYYINGLLKW